jgi:BRO family, N-terminal domain
MPAGMNVRVVTIDGNPRFVAADVCAALDSSNPSPALAALDADQKGITSCDALGGRQKLNIISKSGLYLLILRAQRVEVATRFVTRESSPSGLSPAATRTSTGIVAGMRRGSGWPGGNMQDW